MALRARDEKTKMPASIVINSIVADMSDFIKRSAVKTETTVTVGGMNNWLLIWI